MALFGLAICPDMETESVSDKHVDVSLERGVTVLLDRVTAGFGLSMAS